MGALGAGQHLRGRSYALVLACGALIAGCAPAPPAPDVSLLRNPTTPFAGTVRFDASEFAGGWVTVACIGTCAASARYVMATDGVLLRQADGAETAYVSEGPGVLREMGALDRLVVMWVDEGFRTAAIGDADGRWAAIIDRTGRGGTDRIAAAREILDFNGWETAKLEEVKR